MVGKAVHNIADSHFLELSASASAQPGQIPSQRDSADEQNKAQNAQTQHKVGIIRLEKVLDFPHRRVSTLGSAVLIIIPQLAPRQKALLRCMSSYLAECLFSLPGISYPVSPE
jgi:hypothetical protein